MRSPWSSTAFFLFSALLSASLGVSPGLSASAKPEPGSVDVRVILVKPDMSLLPVPRHALVLKSLASDSTQVNVITGFDGALHSDLPAGRYRITSEHPVEFEGKRFSWDTTIEVAAGAPTRVDLSNDNARIESGGSRRDAGDLYQRFKDGVFKILVDNGSGSGFLVSSDGLIVTNHHVVAEARYLAAKLDDSLKYQVTLVASDPQHDLAVLRIHADAIAGRPVLPLSDDQADKAAFAVGDPLTALGNPLGLESVMTTGVVGKIGPDKIFSDISANPGSSGGPVFDAEGRVVGVTTFIKGDGVGPGVTGITRIYLARGILDAARGHIADRTPPSSRRLLVESPCLYDPVALRSTVEARLTHGEKTAKYQMTVGDFLVEAVTPVSTATDAFEADHKAAETARRRGGKQPDGAVPEDVVGNKLTMWSRNEDHLSPVVVLIGFPKVGVQTGLGRMGKPKFEADFDSMEVRRADQSVEPVRFGRIRELMNYSDFHDYAVWGRYEYLPETFAPGAEITLRIWKRGAANPKDGKLSPELLAQLQRDFEPYFKSVAGGCARQKASTTR